MINPYLIDRPASISFSGGATSGYMLWRILQAYGGTLPDDIKVCFANTGLEHPKTLDFIRDVEINWGVKVHWLEFAGNKQFKEVNYETASRNGEPFDVLLNERNYFPSVMMRFCTGILKIRTITRFLKKQNGFGDGWTEAIGLRYDEPRRVAKLKNSANHSKNVQAIAPMYSAKNDLQDVEGFWDCQPFRLGIPQYLGNCVGCFLKSGSKTQAIARQFPEFLEWWKNKEEQLWADKDGNITRTNRFRLDRPSYRGLIQMAQDQQEFQFSDDDTLPCNCTD